MIWKEFLSCWSCLFLKIVHSQVIPCCGRVEFHIFNVFVSQAVLQTGGQLELEVRPLFLVPDTNGFIDHLEGLKKLLQCGTYIIVVPLIGKTETQKQRKEGKVKV